MTWSFAHAAGGPLGAELDGPLWDGAGLLFASVTRSEIYRYEPASDRAALVRHSSVRTRGLAFGPDGRLYGAQTRARRIVWYRDDGASFYLESTIDGRRRNDPQHLAVDRAGRIWSTDLWTEDSSGGPVGYPPLGHCSVLRLDPAPDGTWTLGRMTHDTLAPHSIALSLGEHKVYVTDGGDVTNGPSLRAYRVADDGTVGPPAVLRRFALDDRVAGICVDASGRIVVAAGAPGVEPGPRIEVLDRAGRVLAIEAVPGGAPTACALGGADLDVLFVTTAAGELFRVTGTGLRGIPRGGNA